MKIAGGAGIHLSKVPTLIIVAQVTTLTRSPRVFMSQHMGATNIRKVIGPQLAIMATVLEPQPG